MDRLVPAARNRVFKMRNISVLNKLEELNRSIMIAYMKVFYAYFKFMLYIYRKDFQNDDDVNQTDSLFRKLREVDNSYKKFHADHPYVKLLMSRFTLFCGFSQEICPSKQVRMRLSEEAGSFVPQSALLEVCEYLRYYRDLCKIILQRDGS